MNAAQAQDLASRHPDKIANFAKVKGRGVYGFFMHGIHRCEKGIRFNYVESSDVEKAEAKISGAVR